MIPYYLPHITFYKIIKAFLISDKSEEVRTYFKKYTGKKYVLLTNSARSALYLAYLSLGIKGKVITSPLTCRAALEPIINAGFEPYFIDINKDTLNFDSRQLYNIQDKNVKIIQVIHHGGLVCDMDDIMNYAKEKGLIVIEDCAQSYNANYKGKNAGTFGDISCFSLIKNAFGIGGGILATDDEKLFLKAQKLQESFQAISWQQIYLRIIKNFLETYRTNTMVDHIYRKFMKFKDYSDNKFRKALKRPRKLIFNFFYLQLKDIKKLQSIRRTNALMIINELKNRGLIGNYYDVDISGSSFSKLFVYNKLFDSKKHIARLNKMGIEAMHLEHSFGEFYQERLDRNKDYMKNKTLAYCKTYKKIQNNIISLPLYEKKMNIQFIINSIVEVINENNLV